LTSKSEREITMTANPKHWVRSAMGLALLVGALFAPAVPGPAQTQPRPQVVVPISQVDRSYLRNEVTLQGTITSYKPSWRETAPHSFVLSDGTGNMRIAIWPGIWSKIPFASQLKEGQEITVRVTVAEFRNALEGHLDKAEQIWLGLANPQLAKAPAAPVAGAPKSDTPPAASPAPELQWKKSIAEGLEEAKKTNKNILVLFANPDSDNGRYVEEKIMSDARVRDAVARKFVPVRIDMRNDPELARQLQAFRAGTVGFYSSAGQPLRAHLVPRTADELLDALK
jgi:hypothetical protein